MISKLQTPQIRFTGFNEDWEKSTLSEVADIYDGTHQTPHYTNSGVMFLSVENINTLVSKKCISEADFKRDFKNFPEKNDVLMTRIGDVGTANIVTSSDPLAYYVSLALLKPKNIVPTYLKIAIASDFVQRDIWRRTLHIAFPKKINKNEITKVEIFTPPLQVEQTAIGNLFQNIDQTIALQRRKHEQTQTLKKSLLSKMFPQKGQKQPEIRLNGFSGDWVESELGEAVGVVMGQSPESKYYTNNPKDSILVQGNADLKNGRVVPRVWTVKGTKKASPNDIIMSVRAPVGDIGKTDFDVVIGRGVAAIKGNDFIYQMLMKMKIDDFWKKVSTGSTFESISSSDIKEALIMLPNSQQEQTAIGQFFKQFDDTLSLQAKQLKTLDNLKQALLAKMFV
ncbi:restriction endonuclease subunit S [Psychrobacter sp.]|uniref:restriction endonuclease subunit S n=1 Tax=Psychrobacter sp. TaxID=56811 RepID=UPI003F9D0135